MADNKHDINERGNLIRHYFLSVDRYYFDFNICSPQRGWEQYDTEEDAWYFGIWVNIKDRKILTYAEGDVTVVECPNVEALRAELKRMNEFYGDPPPTFSVIAKDGTLTRYYDERPGV